MFSGRYPDWLCAVIRPFPFQHSILKRSFPRRSGGILFCVSQGDFARCDEQPKTLSLAHSRAAALTRECATIRLFFVCYVSQGRCPRTPISLFFTKKKRENQKKRVHLRRSSNERVRRTNDLRENKALQLALSRQRELGAGSACTHKP